MLVTILTPALNAARFLPDCLRSVATQTYPRERIQHLVVDGESKDGTADLARAAGAEVDVGRDRSMYDALNRAVRLARGEVIGTLNADDLFAPDAVARVVSIFEARPEVEIVVGDYVVDSEAGRVLRRTRADALERIRRGERRGTWVSPFAAFYRASTLRALGEWVPEYRASSDLDLWIRAAARDPAPNVAHTGSVIGTFRVHEASISTGASPERSLRETLEIARRWTSDPGAPPGIRRFALYLERNYAFTLRMWELRNRSYVAKLGAAAACWLEQRRRGPGALGDMLARFE